MTKIEESITAAERDRTYGFLSSLCLKPPSSSLISIILDGSILSIIHEDSESKAYAEMVKFIKEADGITNLEDELSAEHTSLFVLPDGVIPHEAVYLDKEKRLGGRFTVSVRQFYEKAGAEIFKECIEMPDHLGMELEFMGFLCKLEKELWGKADLPALQKCIELQKTFLDEHLSKWVYQCCGKIIERATYGFYRAIAHLIMEFVKNEKKYVAELYEKLYCNKEMERCETNI